MHELSIAVGIVDLAEKEAEKAGAGRILSIELEIGKLSGVELDALEFAWPVAVKNTMLEKTEKVIIEVPGKAKCSACGAVFDLTNLYDACPQCSGFMKDIIQGKELRIKSLIVD
jgi:hydrogenase nickel incorporation protein HypA/HybF